MLQPALVQYFENFKDRAAWAANCRSSWSEESNLFCISFRLEAWKKVLLVLVDRMDGRKLSTAIQTFSAVIIFILFYSRWHIDAAADYNYGANHQSIKF